MATLAPTPQDTPPPTVHSLFYGDRDDSAELESSCTCQINPFSTAIYHCNATRHSFLTATPYVAPHLDAVSHCDATPHDNVILHDNATLHGHATLHGNAIPCDDHVKYSRHRGIDHAIQACYTRRCTFDHSRSARFSSYALAQC
jgi:hypothetical protein